MIVVVGELFYIRKYQFTAEQCRIISIVRVKWSKKSSSGYESDGRQEMTEETKGQSVKSDKVALSIKEGRLDAIVSELWRKMVCRCSIPSKIWLF